MNNETTKSAEPNDIAHPRRIKSFVRRAGRTTAGQQKAYEVYGAQFLRPYQAQITPPASLFAPERAACPVVLEIGFGMGETTAHIASVLPETNFLCCEVHEPGVGALLKRAGEGALDNIRIIAHAVPSCKASRQARSSRHKLTFNRISHGSYPHVQHGGLPVLHSCRTTSEAERHHRDREDPR